MLIQRLQLREGRKAELEKHVDEVNALLRGGARKESETNDVDVENEEWDGIEEPSLNNHEAEYVDEDRFTTVTVEAVEVSRNGLQSSSEHQEDEGRDSEYLDGSKDKQETSSKVPGKKTMNREQPKKPKRKKRFRYENKAERKNTRNKERSKNRKQARERKS